MFKSGRVLGWRSVVAAVLVTGAGLAVTAQPASAAGPWSLVVTKEVDGPKLATDPVNFAFTAACTGTANGNVPPSFELQNGQTNTSANVPEASNCTVTETASALYTTTLSVNDGPYNPVLAATVNGSTGGHKLEYLNTRKTADLVVTKVRTDGLATDTFTFGVSCPGMVPPLTTSVAILNQGSATIAGLPTGAVCTVTEDAAVTPHSAYVTTPSNSQTVTVSANPTNVTFTNTYRRPDLTVTKTVMGTVIAGEVVKYSVVVTNGGNAPASGLTVTDTPVAPLTLGSSVVVSCANVAPAVVAATPCDDSDSLAAGSKRTFTVTTGALSSSLEPGTSLTNNVAVAVSGAGAVAESNTANNTATATATVGTSADLRITKQDLEGTYITPGEQATFRIRVTNDGPSKALGVVVTDIVPAGLVYVSDNLVAPRDCTAASVCTLGDIVVGASVTFEITYNVPLTYDGPLTIRNTATVTSNTPDPDPDDNAAFADVRLARLEITKALAGTPPPPTGGWSVGQSIIFEITASNTGGQPLTGVLITEQLPSTLTSCKVMPIGLAVPFNASQNIASGEKLVCLASHTVTAGDVTAGSVTNTATVDSFETQARHASLTVPLDGAGRLTVDKTVTSAGPYPAGATVSYLIRVTNVGDFTVGNITVTEQAGVTLAGCTVTLPASLLSGTNFTCTASRTLSAADALSSTYVNTATAAGTVTGRPNVSAQGSATVSLVMAPGPTPVVDLTLSKTLSTTLEKGKNSTWTLRVTNNGGAAATGVTIVDTLPTGLSYVSASGAGWSCSAAGQTVTCNLAGSLPAGASSTVGINTLVAASSSGTIVNQAAASSTQPDAAVLNNQASAQGSVVVVAAAGALPETGFEHMRILLLALICLLSGGGYLLSARLGRTRR